MLYETRVVDISSWAANHFAPSKIVFHEMKFALDRGAGFAETIKCSVHRPRAITAARISLNRLAWLCLEDPHARKGQSTSVFSRKSRNYSPPSLPWLKCRQSQS